MATGLRPCSIAYTRTLGFTVARAARPHADEGNLCAEYAGRYPRRWSGEIEPASALRIIWRMGLNSDDVSLGVGLYNFRGLDDALCSKTYLYK